MPPEDYKRFLKFLQAYQCHVRFQQFRVRPGQRAWDDTRATA